MMKNGPNGTYVLRPIRFVASRVISTTPDSARPNTTDPSRRSTPASRPTPAEQLDVAQPERAGPERDRGQVEHERDDDRGDDRPDDGTAHERVLPAERVDQGYWDDRQRQEVGEHPLVEVRREPQDQRDEPGAEDRERERVAREADRQQPERERRGDGHHPGPPVQRDDPAGAPRRAPASAWRAGRRPARTRIRRCRGRARRRSAAPSPCPARTARKRSGVAQSAPAPASASSTSVECETPVAPRGANGSALR